MRTESDALGLELTSTLECGMIVSSLLATPGQEDRMSGMVAPLAADKLDAWEAWIAELNGPRKADFEEMNTRHGLTEHRAYLQPMPDGDYAVLAIHEGPGSDDFLAAVMTSDNEFDGWFRNSIAEIHGMDGSGPMPPLAQRRL